MEKWRNIILICVGCITLIGGLVEIVKIIEQNKSRDKMLDQHIQHLDQHIQHIDDNHKRLEVIVEKIRDNNQCSKY